MCYFECQKGTGCSDGIPKRIRQNCSITGLMCPKVDIDREECTGCGLCYNDECPEIFVEGDSGISDIKMALREGEPGQGKIPESLRACAEKAADACPVSAISVLYD
jgi:ferredoxin